MRRILFLCRYTGRDMPEDFYANQNLIRIFCNSLIVKDSHKDTEIQFKNSVLNCGKMVTIYWRNNIKLDFYIFYVILTMSL